MSPPLRNYWIPDLAFAAAVLTLALNLSLFDAGRRLFRDSDSGWHIRNGEAILDRGALPRIDGYSWSRPGQPWFAWEWGADVAMGAAHRRGGLAGVTLLYVSLLAAVTWLWFRLHWALKGDFFLACAMASPMLSTANLHWLARPHIFGWVLLLVSLLWLERAGGWTAGRAAGVALVLGAVWANLHASFFLLPAIALIYAAGSWAGGLLWPGAAAPVAPYLAAAAGGAAGSLLNPYGWNLHRHVASYLGNAELLSRIGEFQTFNFHNEGAFQIALTLMLSAAGAVLALGQRNVAHALLLGGFSLLALRSARALPLAALLLPLANGAFRRALEEWSGLRPRIRQRLDAALTYSGNLRALDRPFRGYAWAPLLVAGAWALLQTPAMAARIGFPADEFPVQAAAAVEALPAGARILAPDKFGGYLIYRFAGRRKVFFDGRSDFYGVEFMRNYIDLVQVRPGWEKQLDAFAFTHALLPLNYTLAAVLPRLGWRETWRDRTAVLLEAPRASQGERH